MVDARRTSTRVPLRVLAVFLLVFAGLAGAAEPDTRANDSSTVSLPAAEAPPPNFIRQIGADFKNVFTTKENLLIVATGLGATWGASHFDDRVASSGLNSELHQGNSLDQVFESGEILGGALVQVGSALTTFGLGKLLTNPEAKQLGRDLVRAQIVTQTLTFATKAAVGRERPDGSNHKSFPSGHASGTFATATVLHRHYGWKVGGPAYAVASYVATSRLSEAKHHLSDVVFGAAVGILAGRTVTLNLGRARFAVLPMVTPGGYGVQLALLGGSSDVRSPRQR